MSANRTSLVALHMSAFGGKADMTFGGANVRLWPKADMHTRAQGDDLRTAMAWGLVGSDGGAAALPCAARPLSGL